MIEKSVTYSWIPRDVTRSCAGAIILAENMDCNFVTIKSYNPAKANEHNNIFHVLEDTGHSGACGVNEC